MFVNSIVNHEIWKCNEKIQQNEIVFDKRKLLSAILRATTGRNTVQNSNRLKHCCQIENLDLYLRRLYAYYIIRHD